jgi:endothelin-converting enzyme/putative endopeptidase
MRADDAVNMGGIGAVIGHELTHGFDDQGRQFDARGNLRDWWTAKDTEAFKERAQCFVDQYSKYVAIDDVHLNGKLTLGENTADNGGVRLALFALRAMSGMNSRAVEGFTPEQQFFISFGQIWCDNARPEVLRLRTQVDSHSPNKFRVMGVLSNMPEFQKVFSCKPDSPMVSPKPCRVW